MGQAQLISVIMPIYNAEEYLARAVKSIQDQTHPHLEIILINDGSTDNSGPLCDGFAKTDPRIKVIHQKNQGVSAARNQGLACATGSWVGFVDADDWAAPCMFEKLLAAAVTSNKPVATCGHTLHDVNGNVYSRTYHALPATLSQEKALLYLMSTDYYEGYLWNKIFNKDWINKLALLLAHDIHFCEDLIFCCQFFSKTDGIAIVPDALYHYCMMPTGATQTFNSKRVTELAARARVIALISYAPKALKVAKFQYANAAINLSYLAAINQRDHRQPKVVSFLRKEALRYSFHYFTSLSVKPRLKFKGVAVLLFPQLSARIWALIKRRFNISFYARD